MTFPRRLTPSDKERATIVQQRMTPGGALGVASRHVRNPPAAPSTSAAGTGPSILATAEYADFSGTTIPGTGHYGPLLATLNDSAGDAATYFDTDGVNVVIQDDGYYSATARAALSGLSTGDETAIGFGAGSFPSQQLSYGQYKVTSLDSGQAYPFCGGTTPVFMVAGDLLRPDIRAPIGATVSTAFVFITRWA